MRLWSLHPKYLDARGLVGLWREGLLAKAVLEGKTRGYRSHPQLVRFRMHADPQAAINAYLHAVLAEARVRDYRFDPRKLAAVTDVPLIPVTDGQLRFEWGHLQEKLRARAPTRYRELLDINDPEPHPLFVKIPGPVAWWEVVR